ncbi:MAG: mannitol-1-phosphate 5-dehydrogenase [bacterium]
MFIVQFGAGNIGRGLIGHIFYKAGYKIIFADVNKDLISNLRREGRYIVRLISDSVREEVIDNFEIFHIEEDREVLIDFLSKASIISTAVGPNIYLSLAPIIAEGLKRHRREFVNVIAGENFYLATTQLREEISKFINPIPDWIGFPDVEIARIVPPGEKGQLTVSVEDYDEFLIDKSSFVGPLLNIPEIEFVDNFELYWRRKIYTINMSHAILGYLGYLKGYSTVIESIRDSWIREILDGALKEVIELLSLLGLGRMSLEEYAKKVVSRLSNEKLGDTVIRVGRDPIRKLGPNDRLVGPALECERRGLPYEYLATGIAGALLFDYLEDEMAIRLQEKIRKEGIDRVLKDICNVLPDSSLGKKIKEKYSLLSSIKRR